METKPVYNEDLHFEHEQWKRELAFWEDELRTFKNRLAELLNRWSDQADLATLDHFENRFKIHQSKIEDFRHHIHAHELNIARHYEAGENVMDRVHFNYHLEFREQMQMQRSIYLELKNEFYQFVTQYMHT